MASYPSFLFCKMRDSSIFPEAAVVLFVALAARGRERRLFVPPTTVCLFDLEEGWGSGKKGIGRWFPNCES